MSTLTARKRGRADHPVALRNVVRFSVHGVPSDATVGAELVLTWLRARWRDGEPDGDIGGDEDCATFAFFTVKKYAKYGRSRRYAIATVRPRDEAAPAAGYREAPRPAVFVLEEEGPRDTWIWFQRVLETSGAFDVRWFSREEWDLGEEGARLPY